MKLVDAKDNTYIDSMELLHTNDKDPKFKVGDHVRISKYKNIFAKGYTPNWSEEVFVIKKVKNTVPWSYVINNAKLGLSNYGTKTDIKNISHVDTSSFVLKSNLASLKAEADKLDINKLVLVPVDLSKLSDIVKNDVKKTVYDKLIAKVNSIDTSRFVLKTQYDADKTESENNIPDTSGLVKKQITMLKSLKQKVKYQVLVVQLQILH